MDIKEQLQRSNTPPSLMNGVSQSISEKGLQSTNSSLSEPPRIKMLIKPKAMRRIMTGASLWKENIQVKV